jgi:hypothetical protein
MLPMSSGLEVDSSRVLALDAAARKQAAPILIAGLESCEPEAATLIAQLGLESLVPELEDVAAPANISSKFFGDSSTVIRFRLAVLDALNQLDPKVDRSGLLVPLLTSPIAEIRIRAAFAARRVRLDKVRALLLDRVRSDDNSFVRSFAAESLLVLGDVYPQNLGDHSELFQDLMGPWERDVRKDPMGASLGQGHPSAEDRAGFERAARTLEQLMAARAAQGACPPPVQPARTHVEVQRLRPDLVAIGFDVAIGPCDKQIAVVAFIESVDGFDKWLPSEVVDKKDPTPVRLGKTGGALELMYSRVARALNEGGQDLTQGANVVVLVAHDGHATVGWRGTLDLRLHKGSVVRELVGRSPELKAQLRL